MRLVVLGLAALLSAGCTVVVRPADPSAPRAQRPPDAPPPVTVAPVLVVVAGTQVSYVSNWPEDVFLYEGRWYRPYRGAWYRAVRATGPWAAVSRASVPRPILALPGDYRTRRPPAPAVVLSPRPAPPVSQSQTTVVHQHTTVVVQPPPPPVVVQQPAPPAPPQPAPVVAQAPPPPAPPQPAPVVAQAPSPPAPLPPAPVVVAAPPPVPPPAVAVVRAPPPLAAHTPPAHGARARGTVPGRVTVSPNLAAIEGSPVAYVENWPEPLFHFGDLWYRSVQGAWFRASDVAGEWTALTPSEVPQAVRDVPADYHRAKPGRGPAVPPTAGPPDQAKGRKRR